MYEITNLHTSRLTWSTGQSPGTVQSSQLAQFLILHLYWTGVKVHIPRKMYPFKRTQHSYPVLSLSSSCFDRASLVAQLVKKKKKLPVTAAGFDPWVGVFPRRRERLPTPVFWPGEFPGLYSLLLLLSRFSRVRLCATPETAPPFLGFSRQERWSGSPFPSPMHASEKWTWSRSVVSHSSRPHGLQSTRLLRPWDFSRQEYWSGLPLPSPLYSLRGCKESDRTERLSLHFYHASQKRIGSLPLLYSHPHLPAVLIWYFAMT